MVPKVPNKDSKADEAIAAEKADLPNLEVPTLSIPLVVLFFLEADWMYLLITQDWCAFAVGWSS